MNFRFWIIFIMITISPLETKAEWVRVFSIDIGDLFIDSSSVKRDGNSIFYNQLVNYRTQQSNGALSFVTNSEVNCSSLSIRALNYQLYKKKMAKGKNFYNGKPSKKWKTYKPGTSAYLINKLLCERVHKN